MIARALMFAAALAAFLAPPALAAGSHAPGRVVFPVDGGVISRNVDGGGAGQAVALPDGSAVLVGSKALVRGFYAAKIGPGGALDPSYGTAGVAHVAPSQMFGPVQVLVQPDGKVLVIGFGAARSRFELGQLLVARLNPDGTLDTTYGSGGIAQPGIELGCAACGNAALQPDGALVVAGATGQNSPDIVTNPNAPPDFHWVVARLTPSGGLDPAFGSGGIATIPSGSSIGFNVALLPDGRIVTEAQSGSISNTSMLLSRLTPAGTTDPTFNGGNPVTLPLATGFSMLASADGSVVAEGRTRGSSGLISRSARLVRVTSSGAPDGGFGSGGVAELGSAIDIRQLLPAAGSKLLVVGPPTAPVLPNVVTPAQGRVAVERINPDGSVDTSLGGSRGLTVTLPFGGGGSSFVVSVRPRPLPSIRQNSFAGSRLVPRSDGSFLVVGGVVVTQPTGEGAGKSIFRFAAGALTSSFAPDSTFGGPASPLRATVRVPRQSALGAFRRHGVRIRVSMSAPGLVLAKVRAGRRVVAQSVLPIFKPGRRVLPVELTAFGNRFLRGHRRVRVTVSATAHDLLAGQAAARARGTLR